MVMIRELQHASDFHHTLSSNTRVVVNFFSPFSRACGLIEPTIEQLANEAPHITFVKADIEKFEEVGAEIGVVAFPTFIFFKDGVRQANVVVGANKAELEKEVRGFS
ncbi:thioredoxin family protein [Streptomyces sp. NPDC056296]|uniref:thioredoxin family protein n=1 Tax=Streptomyces sp. NPDC056296 TaxID=3345775 RepID=UPI0035E35153